MGRPRVLTDEERKAKDRAYTKAYRENPEKIKLEKEYREKPEVKARLKEYAKGYRENLENKVRLKEYHSRPEYKAKKNNAYSKKRLKVLQYYSKHLSNSNTPCCNCCGENSHLDFLAIDHISGRKKMDSEPELVKLGYSSKLKDMILHKWLRDNNFPKGFQILCHNCNFVKGHSKDNKCPHERK